MATELKFVNISGTRLDFTGSQTIQIKLVCGLTSKGGGYQESR